MASCSAAFSHFGKSHPCMKNFRNILLLIGLVCVASCGFRSKKRNQIQNLPSPSGNYVLQVPIESNTSDPRYSGTAVWKVTILDRAGRQEYKDEGSTMVGNLNIYWGWDSSDQVWVYNSDDAGVTRWTKSAEGWVKHEREGKSGIPKGILPASVR